MIDLDADDAARIFSAATLIAQGVAFAFWHGVRVLPGAALPPDPEELRKLRDDEILAWRALGAAREDLDRETLGDRVAEWVVAASRYQDAQAISSG